MRSNSQLLLLLHLCSLDDRGAADVRFCADALHDVESFALFVGGTKLDKAGRVDMLTKLRGGEVPPVLEVEAITYIQGDEPNRKYVRFDNSILSAFARSFVGQPFLRDHNSTELNARGGTITEAKLIKLDDGRKAIQMKLSLVKAWAIEGVLDGTIDRFSIGWARTGPVTCSVHKTEVFTKCDCMPGMKLGEKVVQFIFSAAEGTEVSAVNVPAVVGTAVKAISQLDHLDRDTLAGILGGTRSLPEKKTMDPKLLAALGLAADATLDQVLAAIAAKGDQSTVQSAQLQLLQQQVTELTAANAQRAKDAQTAETNAKKLAIDTSIGQLTSAGKIKPGSEVEQALRRMGERDLTLFQTQVADMLGNGAAATPAGAPLPAATPDTTPKQLDATPTEPKQFLTAAPESATWLARAGITHEQFAKHGSHAREVIAAQRAQGSR